jgi:molybdopterin/thiamine biosynthesis adenylyltransferase
MDSQKLSNQIISYNHGDLSAVDASLKKALVIGAGALGNFAGLCLSYAGMGEVRFVDPDKAESTNLNRQVFLYDGVKKPKAETLSRRFSSEFGLNAHPDICYFNETYGVDDFDVVFDCVDNFETRILLSEECKRKGKILVSGGTNVSAGQALLYNPLKGGETPAEFLGLYRIVGDREVEVQERNHASCTYRPDPSVIMTNQIISGFMVDLYMQHLAGNEPKNIFYDSTSDKRF